MPDKPLLRILIVEDDEDDFVILNDYIKQLRAWNCEIKWIFRYQEAVDALCNDQYTICFSDYRLGIKTGIDLLRDLRQRNCNTPVILLTGKGNYEIDIEATKAGAYDYLIKGELDEDKLERTIRYTLERAANLQRIRSSEQKYRSFFEKSKDVVFMAREDTTFLTINFAVTEVLETSEEEAIGRKLTDFFINESAAEDFLDKLSEDGEIENYEVEMLSGNKTVKNCLITASMESDADNGDYLQGIIHDITSLKKAELASLQAEKLAATGRFIRTLAHEVRNPLNNINLSVENLLHQITGDDDRIYIEIIERNGKRINDLITELLQSARQEELVVEPLSLLELLDRVIDSVKDRVMLRKINIHFKHSDDKCVVKGDPAKLEMAFLNIIINAIEAVKDETGLIEVLLHCKEDEATVLISDNGCGMTAETKARLFEPYFTSKRNGLGLGLASTLTIFTAHKASIEVHSQLNLGTVFQVKFR